MKAVFSELHKGHDPQFVLVRGVVKHSNEQPERAESLLSGLRAGNHQLSEPRQFDESIYLRVHSRDYIELLKNGWRLWQELGDAGPEMVANVHPVRIEGSYPKHIVGRLGWHTSDTSCPIGPGTWDAACVAANVATTAAQMIIDGESASYALCRPPGHHASCDIAGGFCFLNNTAIAAAHLRTHFDRVAILDVDVHHGNGTQAIFYDKGDMLTISIHADPSAYYPFFWGYDHERGVGNGLGANLNIPLPLGTGDDEFVHALSSARNAIAKFSPGALVVALGLDASESDPHAGFAVSTNGFGRIGRAIGEMNLPTVLVQEGGYLSNVLSQNLTAVLAGFETTHCP